MSVRVVCLGNELVSDDGIGIRVGRVLLDLPLPSEVRVEFRPGLGLELLDMLDGDETLIVVDAMRTGREPGTCSLVDLTEVDTLAKLPYCCHGFGIAEVLAVGRALMPERLPSRVLVVGIEAEKLDEFDMSLSPSVRKALPEAVSTVLRVTGATEDLIAMGQHLAQQREGFDPSPHDVPVGAEAGI